MTNINDTKLLLVTANVGTIFEQVSLFVFFIYQNYFILYSIKKTKSSMYCLINGWTHLQKYN